MRQFTVPGWEVSALAAKRSAPLAVSLRDESGVWRQYGRPVSDVVRRRFEIGSVSKALTGSLLGVLVESGDVDPDQPVTEVGGRSLPWKVRPPTLAELAAHRSGLPNTPRALQLREAKMALGIGTDDPWRDVDASTYSEYLAQAASKANTGARFAYSSMGVGLLADALAQVCAVPFLELMHHRLLHPLGLERTGCDKPESGPEQVVHPQNRNGKQLPYLRDCMPAAGMFASTLADLQRLAELVHDPAASPLGPGIARAVTPRFRVNKHLSVGYCWLINSEADSTTVLHNGGTWGSQAHLSVDTKSGRAVVALSGAHRNLDGFAMRYLR